METQDILDLNEEDLEAQLQKEGVEIQTEQDKALVKKVSEQELRIRKMELAVWAEKKNIFKGAPKIKELNRVWKKLKKGVPLVRAIKGVCSYTSWRTWREQYPEILAMEEQCREERIAFLQDESLRIASDMDRTRMGEVSRDKLLIDTMQNEINRYDRLTEMRMKMFESATPAAVQNAIEAPFEVTVTFVKPKSKEQIKKEIEDIQEAEVVKSEEYARFDESTLSAEPIESNDSGNI